MSLTDRFGKDLVSFMKDALSKPLYYPAMALCAIMDTLFGDEKWWEYEYETILQELSTMGMPKPNNAILGEIQCIAALRNGKALIDKEWHLFEKSCAALTGIPVLFYEKQNLPIENVLHAMNLMRKFGPFEMSDEVKHYVGCEAINDELFWHPFEIIDNYLYQALQRLKVPLGFDMKEIDPLRERVSERFDQYEDVDIDKAVFKEDSVEDQMCLRIFTSLARGKALLEAENEALNTFNNIKEGVMTYSSHHAETAAEIPEDEESSYDLSPDLDIVDLDSGDVETFEDGVKTAALELAQQFKDLTEGFFEGTNPFEAFPEVKLAGIPSQQLVFAKLSGIKGSPIQTGAYIGHLFPEEHTEFDLEETSPMPSDIPAEEVMQNVVDTQLDNDNNVSDDDIKDPFI